MPALLNRRQGMAPVAAKRDIIWRQRSRRSDDDLFAFDGKDNDP